MDRSRRRSVLPAAEVASETREISAALQRIHEQHRTLCAYAAVRIDKGGDFFMRPGQLAPHPFYLVMNHTALGPASQSRSQSQSQSQSPSLSQSQSQSPSMRPSHGLSSPQTNRGPLIGRDFAQVLDFQTLNWTPVTIRCESSQAEIMEAAMERAKADERDKHKDKGKDLEKDRDKDRDKDKDRGSVRERRGFFKKLTTSRDRTDSVMSSSVGDREYDQNQEDNESLADLEVSAGSVRGRHASMQMRGSRQISDLSADEDGVEIPPAVALLWAVLAEDAKRMFKWTQLPAAAIFVWSPEAASKDRGSTVPFGCEQDCRNIAPLLEAHPFPATTRVLRGSWAALCLGNNLHDAYEVAIQAAGIIDPSTKGSRNSVHILNTSADWLVTREQNNQIVDPADVDYQIFNYACEEIKGKISELQESFLLSNAFDIFMKVDRGGLYVAHCNSFLRQRDSSQVEFQHIRNLNPMMYQGFPSLKVACHLFTTIEISQRTSSSFRRSPLKFIVHFRAVDPLDVIQKLLSDPKLREQGEYSSEEDLQSLSILLGDFMYPNASVYHRAGRGMFLMAGEVQDLLEKLKVSLDVSRLTEWGYKATAKSKTSILPTFPIDNSTFTRGWYVLQKKVNKSRKLLAEFITFDRVVSRPGVPQPKHACVAVRVQSEDNDDGQDPEYLISEQLLLSYQSMMAEQETSNIASAYLQSSTPNAGASSTPSSTATSTTPHGLLQSQASQSSLTTSLANTSATGGHLDGRDSLGLHSQVSSPKLQSSAKVGQKPRSGASTDRYADMTPTIIEEPEQDVSSTGRSDIDRSASSFQLPGTFKYAPMSPSTPHSIPTPHAKTRALDAINSNKDANLHQQHSDDEGSDEEYQPSVKISHSGYLTLRSKQPRLYWFELREGILYYFKSKDSKQIVSSLALIDASVNPQPHLSVGNEYVFQLHTSTDSLELSCDHADDTELWMTSLRSSAFQQLFLSFYEKKKLPTQVLGKEGLEIFESLLRCLAFPTHSVKSMYETCQLIADFFKLNPTHENVVERIKRACSLQRAIFVFEKRQAFIMSNSYYTTESFKDTGSFQDWYNAEDRFLDNVLTMLHQQSLVPYSFSSFSTKGTDRSKAESWLNANDYHSMYNGLLKRLLQHENPYGPIQTKRTISKATSGHVGLQSLSESSDDLLSRFSQYYGVGSLYQRISLLQIMIETFEHTESHLELIETELSVIGELYVDKSAHPTVKETQVLHALLDRLQSLLQKRLESFTEIFQVNRKDHLTSLQKIVFMLESLSKLYLIVDKVDDRMSWSLFSEWVSKAVKIAVEYNYEYIRQTVTGRGEDEGAQLSIDELARMLVMVEEDLVNIREYETVFPESIKILPTFVNRYYKLISEQLLFIAQMESEAGKSDPFVVLQVCKKWRTMRDTFSEYLKDEKPLPLVTLFSVVICKWVSSTIEQYKSWIIRFCSADQWDMIDENVRYSSSVVDLFSALSQCVELLKGVEHEEDRIADRPEIMDLILDGFTQILHTYVSRLHELCMKAVKPVDKGEPNITSQVLVQINDMEASRSKFDELLQSIDPNFGENETKQDKIFRITRSKVQEALQVTVILKFTPTIRGQAGAILESVFSSEGHHGKSSQASSSTSSKPKRSLFRLKDKDKEREKEKEKAKEKAIARETHVPDGDDAAADDESSKVAEILRPYLDEFADVLPLWQTILLDDLFAKALRIIWSTTVEEYCDQLGRMWRKDTDIDDRLLTIQEALDTLKHFLHADGQGLPLSLAEKGVAQLWTKIRDLTSRDGKHGR